MTEETKNAILIIVLVLAIIAGLLKFDGLCIAFSILFAGEFIERAIKSLKDK